MVDFKKRELVIIIDTVDTLKVIIYIECINKPNKIRTGHKKRSTLNAKWHFACFFVFSNP